jgi:predicted SAM-dependent methyltransferase
MRRIESPAARDALLAARGAAHWALRGHVVRRRALARARRPLRLQIGGGGNPLPGWLNSDLIAGEIHLDLRRRLPLPDGSVEFVFGEHVIEHLPEPAGARLLRELHRVIRPGGVVRLTTPDLKRIIAIYEDRNDVVSRDDYARFLDGVTGKRHERPAQILNDYLRLWGHRHVYDEQDLRARLLEAGFSSVERVEPGESRHEPLRGLERHGGEPWVNRAEAMTLEATRSGR